MMDRYKKAFNRLQQEISRVSESQGLSKYGLYVNAAWCFLRYGITPNEYMGWNCWEDSGRKLKGFYTARDSSKYERLFNNHSFAHYFDNKVDFNKKFCDFVKREWVYTKECTLEETEEFIRSHEKVIVKPIGLSSGHGIYCIEPTKWGGVIPEDCLIEEFVKQHPSLMELNPTSVNTIRVYTLINKDGSPKILSASIRVGGGKDSEVDNYHSGGCGYPIDVETGIIYKPGTDIRGDLRIFHPSTGVQMVGFKIPNWEALKRFVYDAMKVIPETRLIAWDVAVLQDGFEMIEGNCNGDPGFMQAPSKQGKKKEILKEL